MADAHPKLSRRALLGAVCAAPALCRHSGLDPESTFLAAGEKQRWTPDRVRGDARVWARALARYREAEAMLGRLEGGPDEDAFGLAHDALNAALLHLVAAPSPDLAALAAKLAVIAYAEAADLAYAPPALAALAEDAGRLAGLAAPG